MKYFSGFCLRREESLFDTFLENTAYTVAGFSYGTIRALEYTLESKERIDCLQLISPAFFQDKPDSFKRMQLFYFVKDPRVYIKNFLTNCTDPSDADLGSFRTECGKEELEALLYYTWSHEKLQKIVDRGVRIEVYLGNEDKIINAKKAYAFFKQYATVYLIKNVGHILK